MINISLDDKTKDYALRNTAGLVHSFVFMVKICIRTYWATKYESRSENKFGWLAAVCLMHADISSYFNKRRQRLAGVRGFLHWNKRTSFVFHKIVVYNLWTWKQSQYLLSARSLQVFKAFSVIAWDWGQNRSLHLVSCVFSVWRNKTCRRLTKLQVNTKFK